MNKRYDAVVVGARCAGSTLATLLARAGWRVLLLDRREPSGPGWALLGDASHFKHPVTAQGIGDAVQQAVHIAADVTNGGELSGYRQWRDDRAEEHYDFSFGMAKVGPDEQAGAHYAGVAADPVARQVFLDVLSKQRKPSEVTNPDRQLRWRAAWAYEDGSRRVRELVQDLGDDQLATKVPACPEWTVKDLVAHLTGIAQDTVAGSYYLGAIDAWRDPALAVERDRWTAGQVAARDGRSIEHLLAEFDEHGRHLAGMLRRGTVAGPSWVLTSPVADLAVHLNDLHEALGVKPDPDAAVTRMGFAAYRAWLQARIGQTGLPQLRLSDGTKQGEGPTVTAQRHDLFRAITGRASETEIRAYEWSVDPDIYVPVISPYPLPAQNGA